MSKEVTIFSFPRIAKNLNLMGNSQGGEKSKQTGKIVGLEKELWNHGPSKKVM